MKRSKLFLGITGSLLAVAGLAAAKNHRHLLTHYYYLTVQLSCITVSVANIEYTLFTVGGQVTYTPTGDKVFRTKNLLFICATPIYKGGN
jgi:hypothetical protein